MADQATDVVYLAAGIPGRGFVFGNAVEAGRYWRGLYAVRRATGLARLAEARATRDVFYRRVAIAEYLAMRLRLSQERASGAVA